MSERTLSLYELSDEALALDELTAMEDGEFTTEVEALHTELMDKLVAKADDFGAYVKELESRTDVLAAEVDRLQQRKKRLQNRVSWMKAYATTALQRMGRPRLEGAMFTLALANNPPRVEVTVLPDALPPEFVRVIPEVREPDKTALAKALKAGQEIPGVALVQTQSLRIR